MTSQVAADRREVELGEEELARLIEEEQEMVRRGEIKFVPDITIELARLIEEEQEMQRRGEI